MKEYFNIHYHNWKFNWNKIITRFIIYVFGVYFFGLGVALYVNTQVGASHMDIINFAFIAIITGLNNNGSLRDLSIYPIGVLIFYLSLLVIVIALRTTNAIITYKKNHNKHVFYNVLFNSLFDLITVFIWSYSIKLSQLYIPVDQIGQLGYLARTWIFMAAFIIYCLGVTLAVFAHMLFGPYNGLSLELHLLTKWNYKLCRLIVDIAILTVGLVVMITSPAFSWDLKTKWLTLYFSFGTIFMGVIAGPVVIGTMLLWIKEKIKIEAWFKTKQIKH